MASKDRFLQLLASSQLNGIDFVEVTADAPLDLVVHFVNANQVKGAAIHAKVEGGDSVPAVELAHIAASDWQHDGEGRPLLILHALYSGDFAQYTLTLDTPKLDIYYRSAKFSFKAFCPSDFDCAPPPHECPPDDTPLPPIDYLAKDFASFRRALSDFSAQRYPNWQERSEADFGMMFLEALSALGDDLSYQQDRIAAEATLSTATERRSIVRHARLVDYTPGPATSAKTWLVCAVGATALPAGIEVYARNPDGSTVPFEIGEGLRDTTNYAVNPLWNNPIAPYWLDDSERCLFQGATQMWLTGTGYGFGPGVQLLIDTQAPTTADPPIRQLVTIDGAEETTDPLFGNAPITHIYWSADYALSDDHDLTLTTVRGNIVRATQGQRRSERFAIDIAPTTAPQMPLAFARLGANSTPDDPLYDYRYTLRDTPLAWLSPDDTTDGPQPEIVLVQPDTVPLDEWQFTADILRSDIGEQVFSIEPAAWRRVATLTNGKAQVDYAGNDGETILFGNDVFGAAPRERDVFEVTYRVGMGAQGNVAADSITGIPPAYSKLLLSVTNPFAAAGGADRETDEQIRRRAPQAFQAVQFRAVRAEDYEAAAETLDWVQQAGTTFRWTGSWFTVFTSIDPKSGLPIDRHIEVINLLNRRRLAGYESYVPPPRYISFDLDIEICAREDAFRADVERDVMDSLAPTPRKESGFFFADHFTFGTPLERSRIEAAIQKVGGVAGVESIRYRRRDLVPDFVELPPVVMLATDEILRIDNDASYPERGAIKLTVCGGR